MEHAMSAFYPDLPHGAGLIMISNAYFAYFKEKVPERLALMATAMGKNTAEKSVSESALQFLDALSELQQACSVSDLKMSDYGIREDEIPKFAQNARETMGALFEVDPYPMTTDDVIDIYRRSYR